MKYAILSDMHGNHPAMRAVINDAAARGIDGYLMAGDYYADFPWPNEVAEAMRALPALRAVRGNKEGYLIAMAAQDQATWTDEQSAALYWSFRELTDKNRGYLMALPEELAFEECGVRVRMFHRSSRVFKGTKLMQLGSDAYMARMEAHAFDHADYLRYVGELTAGDPAMRAIVDPLPPTVFIFGHSHVQWHARVGGALLINPGSCGLPLDYDARVPYTMLELVKDEAKLTELRVPYDAGSVAEALKSSVLGQAAPIWCELILDELTHSRECVSRFLGLAERIARRERSEGRPYEDRIWHMAADAWRAGERDRHMVVRKMQLGDYEAAYCLWTGTKGMGMRSKDDSREGIERFLLRNPNTCFVAEEGGELVGAVLCGHDGRRAYVYHAAVREDMRRRGVGRALIDSILKALKREGILKAALVVFKRNEIGNAFWAKEGWEMREDLNYYNLSLDQDNR